MTRLRVSTIIKSIHNFYIYGIHNDEDLDFVKGYVNELKSLKAQGAILSALADTVIEEGETTIERYYSYCEERASLGDNWW